MINLDVFDEKDFAEINNKIKQKYVYKRYFKKLKISCIELHYSGEIQMLPTDK